jgi:hypothetical protein
VLEATLVRSPLGGDFGTRLDVPLPTIPGVVLEHFDTTVGQIVSSKKTKKLKSGKKKTTKTFFVSARCADKDRTWNFQETTTLPGGATVSDSSTQPCKVKRSKKPRKKK